MKENKLSIYEGNHHTEESPDKSCKFCRVYNNLYSDKTDSDNALVTEALGRIFSFRLQILKEPIDEINEEIRARDKLTAELSEEVDAKVRHLDFLLRDLDTWAMGHNDNIENRRLFLMREMLNLEKEKRSERLRFWEDVVSLVNKRRDFITEYKSMKNIRAII